MVLSEVTTMVLLVDTNLRNTYKWFACSGCHCLRLLILKFAIFKLRHFDKVNIYTVTHLQVICSTYHMTKIIKVKVTLKVKFFGLLLKTMTAEPPLYSHSIKRPLPLEDKNVY